MGYQVSGRLHAIFETKQITERFQKREFVIETSDNPSYPQFVQFQLTGDRCEGMESFKVGDPVKVDFSLRGREWTSPTGDVKYFNSLDVWTVEPEGSAGRAAESAPPLSEENPPPFDDDVPF
jgi:hypothetical protein